MTLDDALRDPELAPYVRRWFFERLTAGLIPPEQILSQARRLDMDLEADGYALALTDLPPEPGSAEQYLSDPAAAIRSAVIAFFLKYSEYTLFPLGPTRWAVLIKGSGEQLAHHIRRCVDTVRDEYEKNGLTDWHIAVSSPASRADQLPRCWQEVSRLWAWRTILPERHVLRPETEGQLTVPGEGICPPLPEAADAAPGAVAAFLQNGRREDIPAFVAGYLDSLEPVLAFSPPRHWALLTVQLAVRQSMASLGLSREQLEDTLPDWDASDPAAYLTGLLSAALSLRDEAAGENCPGPLRAAIDHIRRHCAEPDLTLESTARRAGLSASYLSGLFRRTMGCTFTEYLTARRMELARRLLRSTDQPVGEIARQTGYRDSRYFSTLFRRTQGCTPTQFRASQGGPEGRI